MTDHEDNWTEHPTDCYCPRCGDPVTHRELVAESERVIAELMRRQAKLAETIRDQISYLNKTQTVALMAVEMYANMNSAACPNMSSAASLAVLLYRKVEKTLEIDDTITGSISTV